MGFNVKIGLIILLACLAGCITTPDEVVMAPIHLALTTGSTADLERASADRKQLTALNEYGETPLLYSVKRNKPKFVDILLEKGADANAPNPRNGETPLIAAVKNGDSAMVNRLLGSGALCDKPDNEGATPLVWAVRKGNLGLVKTITAKTGTQEASRPNALLAAAGFGHSEVLGYLLSVGGSIQARSGTGETLLIRASRFGHPETVRMLLGKGVDVNSVDANEASALSWAARMGKADIVPLLVAGGAAVDPVDSSGLTPLAHAVRLGHLPVVEFLLEKGASLDVRSKTGEGLMYWAAYQDGIAMALRGHGARPERVGDDSDEPILIAVKYLWLGKFYEEDSGSGDAAGTRADMTRCYKWAGDFFDMAGAANDEAAEALRKKQASADRMAIFLSALSFTAAQMQANLQAQQMSEIGALGNPGSASVGYGYGTYYTPAAFKKSYTVDIPGYLAEAEKCRKTAAACREIVKCYTTGDPLSPAAAACARTAGEKIPYLK